MFRRQPANRRPAGARPVKPSALRPGARPGGGVRRTKPVKRRSAGLTPVRAAAALALLAAIGGLYGAIASDLFSARTTTVSGNTWTSEDQVLAALAVPAGQNVFTVKTWELEGRVEQLPAVAGATVTVALPDQLHVDVAEREALLAWVVDDHTYLVDGDGALFTELGEDPPEEADALPHIVDRRDAGRALAVGSVLDDVTLDAALRLGSLTPEQIGSQAERLSMRLDDLNGFVLHAEPQKWNAIFGFYTPTLRTTDLIPGQVRLLRSFLLAPEHEETNVIRIILADERSGTWVPRVTPKPSTSPKP